MFALLFLFITGASVGSFLNVCIWRLPRGESIVAPPSHCPRCEHQLEALDLVPLLSQLVLRSRCRYCGAKISWRYFGIELLTAILWVLVGLWAGPFGLDEITGGWTGDGLRLAQGLIFVSCLVVIFWVDYDTRLIQLEAVFLLGVVGVAVDLWQTMQGRQTLSAGGFWPGHSLLPSPLPGSLWAMVVIATLLWMVREAFSWLYGKEALGFGDVILAGAIATHLGWNGTLWTFSFCSVVVGALVGVGLQIPRAIRAYRWARRRSSKYFERAQASLAPVNNSVVAPVSDGALETDLTSTPIDVSEVASEQNVVPPVQDGVDDDTLALQNFTLEHVLHERSTSVAAANPELSAHARAEHWHKIAGSLARHAFRKAIPFGPMLAIGATLALLYGEPLNRAYTGWLNAPTDAAMTTAVPYGASQSVPPPLP